MSIKLLALVLMAMSAVAQAAPVQSIKLNQAEQAALAASSQLKSLRAELAAAQDKEAAAFGAVLPKLSADGNWRYLTSVPGFHLTPGGPVTQFGDHHNYSVGLGVNWALFDMGAWQAWKALESVRGARFEEAALAERQLRLKVRLAYFQTQLAGEKVRLLANGLKLAQAQARDIALRLKNGASSRLDALSSKNDVLTHRGLLRQARADLAGALSDLFTLTGLGEGADLTAPLDMQVSADPPADVEPPSFVLKSESLESSLAALRGAEDKALNPDHPQLKAFAEMAESSRHMAAAAQSGYWPRIQAGARASYDYPNGPLQEQVQQNTFTVGAVWPLFSFGQTGKQVKEQQDLALSQESKQVLALSELKNAFQKSRSRLAALKAQRSLDRQSVDASDQIYSLTYSSYRNGGARYLEVESSQAKALETKIRLAQTETQMLIELALLSSLTE